MSLSESSSLLYPGSPAGALESSCVAKWSIADWLCTLIIAVVGYYVDGLPPFERKIGPQLHDTSIAYPHTPLAQQQVPASLLWHICRDAPLLLLVPLALVRPPRGVPKVRLLNELLLGLAGALYGALLLVCLAKNAIGRLRPDFLARCAVDKHGACTGDADTITGGRKSFPSGHSALSFAGLGFLSLALFARVAPLPTPRLGQLWKVVLPLLPWIVALEVALSRIQDYWHHWQDVLVGTLLGHICAYVSFRLRFPCPWPASGAAGKGLVPHVVTVLQLDEASKRRAAAAAVSALSENDRHELAQIVLSAGGSPASL